MTVLPHEPVSYCWTFIEGTRVNDDVHIDWDWNDAEEKDSTPPEPGDVAEVTLANGQRIIVRALSEERKAERARRKHTSMMRSVE